MTNWIRTEDRGPGVYTLTDYADKLSYLTKYARRLNLTSPDSLSHFRAFGRAMLSGPDVEKIIDRTVNQNSFYGRD